MPTKIEWATDSWNAVTGCTKISEGCRNCYAERMARRLAGRFGYPADEPFRVTLHPDRLEQPLKWKKPRRVFVCSMGDLFHHMIPITFVKSVWNVMAACQQHTFLVLTKRAKLMQQSVNTLINMGWPVLPNVGLGVTIEKPEYSWRADYLRRTQAAIRFISFEPLLGSFTDYPGVFDGMDWIIVGCESGMRRRPMSLCWAVNLVRLCRVVSDASIFVKQLPINGNVSHEPSEWPEDLRIREYPEPIDTISEMC